MNKENCALKLVDEIIPSSLCYRKTQRDGWHQNSSDERAVTESQSPVTTLMTQTVPPEGSVCFTVSPCKALGRYRCETFRISYLSFILNLHRQLHATHSRES